MAIPAALLIFVLVMAGCGERAAPWGPPPLPSRALHGSEVRPVPPGVRLPDDVRPVNYALDLTIVPDARDFRGRIAIEAIAKRPVPIVWLNATELDITDATLNGQAAHVVRANEDVIGLDIGSPAAAGPLAIEVGFTGRIDREKSRGIYAEKEGDAWYAYTLFEATDARRAFPCFDQPDAKVPWRLTLHVKQEHVALSNAPVESTSNEGEGMKKVVMAQSRPLPSYLIAFVVGPFEVVEGGVGGRIATPIRFVVPLGRAGELRYAREVTPRVVAAVEDYFDMDYPYGKLDVAVPPRYWGTMEHPGLVAMGQPLTLIKPGEETRERKQAYTSILAHELAHYWFGDLVTLSWWDDTWLNESLATWMDAIITDRLEPEWRLSDAHSERAAGAMMADESLSTKAIRQPVETKQAIESSFDNAITYYKGSGVLKMFEAFVGPEPWRGFIRAYMAKYAWRNASADDFVETMSARLGKPVATAFRSFLDQPGVPLIEHRVVCETAPRIELKQERALPAGSSSTTAFTWQVPVCVRHGDGARSHRSCTLLNAPSGSLALEGGCPKWMVMNADGVGYYRSRYTREEIATLLAPRSSARATAAERRMLIADIDAAIGRDQLTIAEALALVPSVLADRDERIQRAASALVRPLRADVLSDDTYERYERWILATYGPLARELGWRRRRGDSDERQALRAEILPLVALSRDRRLQEEAVRLARAWLADGGAIEDDIAEAVLLAAGAGGDATLFDQILAAARAEKDRSKQLRLITALGGFREPALVTRALDLILDRDFDLRETRAILIRSIRTRETRLQAWAFMQAHAQEVLSRLRSDEASRVIGAIGSTFCDETHRNEVSALFTPLAGKIDGARYALDQALDEVARCIATQARISPSAVQFFGR
jgi:aminopeptidase N